MENGSHGNGLTGGEAEEKPFVLIPRGLRLFVFLFFRPSRFFRKFDLGGAPALTMLGAWTLGMSTIWEKVEERFLRGRPVPFIDSWSQMLVFTAIAGMISGAIWWSVGGWWYRKRLAWSGAANPEPVLSRKVYLYAAQVCALPHLAACIAAFITFPTPVAAMQGESRWDLLLFIFPFWSAWVGYSGARSVFQVRRLAGIIWLFILPSVYYLLFAVAFVVFLLFGGPQLKHPITFESERFIFQYPGNWFIDAQDEDHDPNANLTVEPMQDAFLHIMVYESDKEIRDELDDTLAAFRNQCRNWREGRSFKPWADLHGVGRSAEGDADGKPFGFRFFVARINERECLEIRELWDRTDAREIREGMNFIRSTFRLKR